MKCKMCEKDRPARYIHTAFVRTDKFSGHIEGDPECIRKEFGKIHGVEDYQFTGKQAQYNHKEFMDWVKRQ